MAGFTDTLGFKPIIRLQDLHGPGGNAFAVIAIAIETARAYGVSEKSIDTFKKEMISNDYDHLLRTVKKYFTDIDGVIDAYFNAQAGKLV